MTSSAQPQINSPDPSVIAAQNDAFRRLTCLGVPPAQPIQGHMHVTRSLMEAGDGFMAEAVKATGMFETFEPDHLRGGGQWLRALHPTSARKVRPILGVGLERVV
ncbi:hypothetical protein PVW48_18415 [Dinoroseobacter sp. PD6]|uniref:hypothetical protein n=1 Tax=Dinoroseobacter sp. PD6 TaxID=3028384 RepID=UPI00237B7C42|nr:hypothetical protein [Dinoroseobacter sp. PD6]MDD9718739.1 hypothetical protein [Dinoroseobacter sp. PD6]